VLAVALSPSLYGFGFRLGDQDAFATARGLAFTATADNPSAIFYNPAAITKLDGLSARLGVYGIEADAHYTSEGGETYSTHDNYHAIPHVYLTYHPENSPVAVGFGVYSPFGLSVKYPDDVPFRTAFREGSIQYLALNPVVAVQLTRSLSIAAGVSVNLVEADIQRGIAAEGDTFGFRGGGASVGFTAGLLWQPSKQHSFGLRYISASTVRLSGHSRARLSDRQVKEIKTANEMIRAANKAIDEIKGDYAPYGPKVVEAVLKSVGLPEDEMDEIEYDYPEEDADAKIRFPHIITAGYSFRPTPDWNFEVNVDWTDWEELNTVSLKTQSTSADLTFNYRSSFLYSFGATRYFRGGWRLSGGYIYSENSVPESEFGPAVPDGDRHVFSAGIGQTLDHVNWDLAYQYAWSRDRKIDKNLPGDGTYDFSTHALTLSLGFVF
jgi:long-chain fatty acid transport protein